MPELPDVERFKRYVDATSLHQNVSRVRVLAPALLKGISAQALGQHLKGKTFTRAQRHGKFLFLHADRDGWLLMHFGMTGHLQYGHWADGPPEHTGCSVEFDNGAALAYIAPRKLGRIGWAEDPDTFIKAQGLGPDAAWISLQELQQRAEGRKGTVKNWLMDQSVIAGIGNVYSDEILHRARLHPASAMNKLDAEIVSRLHQAMQEVLRYAIEAKAEPENMPRSFLLPHREEGAKCPACGGTLERVQSGGRSAYFCPGCQPKL